MVVLYHIFHSASAHFPGIDFLCFAVIWYLSRVQIPFVPFSFSVIPLLKSVSASEFNPAAFYMIIMDVEYDKRVLECSLGRVLSLTLFLILDGNATRMGTIMLCESAIDVAATLQLQKHLHTFAPNKAFDPCGSSSSNA